MAKIILILAFALLAFASMVAASPARLDKLPRDRWAGRAEKRAVLESAALDKLTDTPAPADHVKDIFRERGLFGLPNKKKATAADTAPTTTSDQGEATTEDESMSDEGTNQDWGRSHAWRKE